MSIANLHKMTPEEKEKALIANGFKVKEKVEVKEEKKKGAKY